MAADFQTRRARRRFLQACAASGLATALPSGFAVEASRAVYRQPTAIPAAGGCVLCQAVGLQSPAGAAGQRPPFPLSYLAGAAAAGTHSRPAPGVKTGALIIQPEWVLVVDESGKLQFREGQEVVVKDDLIEALRPRRAGRDRRLALPGQVLLPGFISGHTHSAAGVMTRGFIEENPYRQVQGDDPSLPGMSLLRPMVLMEDLSESELDDLTTLNLAEMLRSGCTTQVEMSLSLKQMQSYVRVAARLGLRAYPAGMVPGIARLLPIWGRNDDRVLLDSVAATLAEIEANLDYARRINGTEHGRIRPMMGPSVVTVHTAASFKAIRRAADELGNGIHLHLQNDWSQLTRAALRRVWGRREMEIVQQLGLLETTLFGAHCLGIDLERDLPLMAASPGFTFAHCPSAAGAAVLPSSQPYPEALAAGVNTSIGLDTHSNDYLENIKLAVMQGRARAQLLAETSAVALLEPTIWHALESATLGAARGLGRPDLGRIAAGARADLCSVDISGLLVGNGSPSRYPHNNLLYANGLAVRNVMTDGHWQVQDGRFTFADEGDIIRRGAAVVHKVWARLEAEDFFITMPR